MFWPKSLQTYPLGLFKHEGFVMTKKKCNNVLLLVRDIIKQKNTERFKMKKMMKGTD
jgi:hypothetical protein